MASKTETLSDLLVDELKDLYSAEKQLTHALPKMAEAAHSSDLRKAFQHHLKQTEKQIQRIEKAFAVGSLDGAPGGKKCIAMEGLVKEGNELMKETAGPAVDPALIAAAQKVEHYEIASYGTAVAWAKLLGHDKVAQILQETLNEEYAANEKLTQLAESRENAEAKQ